MKIGICASAQQAASLKEGLVDYVELNLNQLAAMSEDEFKETKALLASTGVPAEVTNCFFPGTIRLCGKDRNMETIREYSKSALERAALLGVHINVLGSGGVRRALEDENLQDCKKQVDEVCCMLGDIARDFESTVVLEPLNRSETNIINTVSEGAETVKRLNHPNILLLADIYHVETEKEPLSVIAENKDLIRHIHIANPEGRLFPMEKDNYNYECVKSALHSASYDLRISIEGKPTGEFVSDAEESLAFLKKMF